METVRAFIAIHLNEALQKELAAAQKSLPLGPAVRWTRPEQIHLTLKFLGEIPAESAEELAASLRRGCETLAPFSLRFDGLGCFPNHKKPRIVWVGLGGDLEALQELFRRVDYECVTLTGRSEDRPFTPHLTLGRVKDTHARELQRIGTALQTAKISLRGEWTVREVSLMRSELTPKGAIHTELAQIELRGANS